MPDDQPDADMVQRRLAAESCIKTHVIAAMGTGLIPSAVLDSAAVAAIEVKMIRDLAQIYDFPVPHRLIAYKLLISVLSGLGMAYVASRMSGLLKGVPLLGVALYVGAFSISGGAAVYAVGKVFQRHYESGGTFLGQEPGAARTHYRESYREGILMVPGLLQS